MTTGETISCIGMTEPSGGSDLQAVKTTAKRDGDDWILNGSKTFISNGILANLGLIAARTNLDVKPAHGISLFLVDTREHEGFKKGQNLRKVGQHTYDTAELFFEDIRLPASAMLGGPDGLNKGFYYMMQELPRERAGLCLDIQAQLEYAFEATRTYTQERMAFGESLSKKQAIRHKMANIKTDIVASRMMTDECVRLFINVCLEVPAWVVRLFISSNMNPDSAYEGQVILFFRNESRIILMCNMTKLGSYFSK